MLTLYGAFRSRASRPLWLLNEIGLDFVHVPVLQAHRLPDPGAPGAPMHTASPEFLAINPMGQIPAMREGGLILTESMAICLHIARVHGGAVGPQDSDELALAENWAFFAATGIEPPALEILQTPADAPDAAARIAAAAGRLARPLARLEGHLAGGRDWLMGGRFTVADIMVAECVRYAAGHPPAMAAVPAVAAWLARAQARPAFRRMWEARLAEPL
jgi:glutathione S-transferase